MQSLVDCQGRRPVDFITKEDVASSEDTLGLRPDRPIPVQMSPGFNLSIQECSRIALTARYANETLTTFHPETPMHIHHKHHTSRYIFRALWGATPLLVCYQGNSLLTLGLAKPSTSPSQELVWYAHVDWEGNGSSHCLSMLIDLRFGQAVTLWSHPPSAPLQYRAY